MYSVAAVFLLFGVAVHATVDFYDCQFVYGWYGELTDCPANHIAVGACGSGAKSDCNGDYTGLKCCKLTSKKRDMESDLAEKEARAACHSVQGDYGQYIECNHNEGLVTLCTSGLHRDCGHGVVTSAMCCDTNGISTTGCTWRGGTWGEFVDCGIGAIMQGYCGSGDHKDCAGYSHQVKCCNLS